MLKVLETCTDIMRIRFGITLNLNTAPFYPKPILNVSKVNAAQKISLKYEMHSKEKIKDKRFQDTTMNNPK